MLLQENLFTPDSVEAGRDESALEDEDNVPGSAFVKDSATERWRRIESLTPAQKEGLRWRQERLARLPVGEQQLLRQAYHLLSKEENASLRPIMFNYYEWLKTLSPLRRAELLALGPEQRVEQIKKLQQEQARALPRRAHPKDAEKLLRWMEELVASREARFLESQPKEVRQRLEKLPPGTRQRAIMWLMIERWAVADRWQMNRRSPFAKPEPPRSPISETELAALRAEMSPDTRQRLETMPPPEQVRVVIGWLREELRAQWGARRGAEMGTQPVDDERLAHFFEHEISDEERERLLHLSGDEMHRELRRMYTMRTKLFGPPVRPPFVPGAGKWAPNAEHFHPRRPEKAPTSKDLPTP
jgi:hypothetical protein